MWSVDSSVVAGSVLNKANFSSFLGRRSRWKRSAAIMVVCSNYDDFTLFRLCSTDIIQILQIMHIFYCHAVWSSKQIDSKMRVKNWGSFVQLRNAEMSKNYNPKEYQRTLTRAVGIEQRMGLVRITSWYPNFNGSHFGLPPSEIHRMTGLPPKIVWTMTYSHRSHCFGLIVRVVYDYFHFLLIAFTTGGVCMCNRWHEVASQLLERVGWQSNMASTDWTLDAIGVIRQAWLSFKLWTHIGPCQYQVFEGFYSALSWFWKCLNFWPTSASQITMRGLGFLTVLLMIEVVHSKRLGNKVLVDLYRSNPLIVIWDTLVGQKIQTFSCQYRLFRGMGCRVLAKTLIKTLRQLSGNIASKRDGFGDIAWHEHTTVAIYSRSPDHVSLLKDKRITE